MSGFKSVVLFMAILATPLSALSQYNAEEIDLEDFAERKVHHRRNPDGFFNPWLAEGEPGGLIRFLKWKLSTNPYAEEKKDKPRFSVVSTQMKEIEAQGDSITYLGHATMWIRLLQQNVITDPLFTDDIAFFIKRHAPFPIPLEELPDFQVVLISHSHYDHLDKASIARLGTKPLYLIPLGYKDWFEDVVPDELRFDWISKSWLLGRDGRLAIRFLSVREKIL